MDKKTVKRLIERFSVCKYCDDVESCSLQNAECFKLKESCWTEIVSFLLDEGIKVNTEEAGNEYSDYAECPYCGCRHDELDHSSEAVCSDCGKRFVIHIHEMYTTSKMDACVSCGRLFDKESFSSPLCGHCYSGEKIRRINE